jgi:peptidoglycan/LPS O-acetylase OafA/YrhL
MIQMPVGNEKGLDEYRFDIDGLRAVAVLAVIVNHFSSSILPAGNLGVDLFFVISGYVITASLSRTKSTSLKGFLASFIFAKRAKRLLPALVACVIPSAILICLSPMAPRRYQDRDNCALWPVKHLALD